MVSSTRWIRLLLKWPILALRISSLMVQHRYVCHERLASSRETAAADLRDGVLLQNFRRATLGFVAQILQQITGCVSPFDFAGPVY